MTDDAAGGVLQQDVHFLTRVAAVMEEARPGLAPGRLSQQLLDHEAFEHGTEALAILRQMSGVEAQQMTHDAAIEECDLGARRSRRPATRDR